MEIEAKGLQSRFGTNVPWLLFIWAHLDGINVLPRLFAMKSNPVLAVFRGGIDEAIALAIGLTGYVSDGAGPFPQTSCFDPLGIRNSINTMIIGLMNEDRALIESSLNSSARKSLESTVRRGGWKAFCGRLWTSKPPGSAIGYKLSSDGQAWEPANTLRAPLSNGATPRGPYNLELFDRLGRKCSTRPILIHIGQEDGGLEHRFRIANRDIVKLLNEIAECAAQTR